MRDRKEYFKKYYQENRIEYFKKYHQYRNSGIYYKDLIGWKINARYLNEKSVFNKDDLTYIRLTKINAR